MTSQAMYPSQLLPVTPVTPRTIGVNEMSAGALGFWAGHQSGSVFLKDHLLMFVLSGSYLIRYRNEQHVVGKNQMVLLRKAIWVEYQPAPGEAEAERAEYVAVSLTQGLLKEYTRIAQIRFPGPAETAPVTVNQMPARVTAYLESFKTARQANRPAPQHLSHIHLLELLFNMTTVDKAAPQGAAAGSLQAAGARSAQQPVQSISEKQLEKARTLFFATSMSVVEICHALGFENIAQFSSLFKARFGFSLSDPESIHQRTMYTRPAGGQA